MEHIKIPKHQHFICLLFYHHCSLNDNFYSLASSWNQIKLRNMTAMVLDKTMSTAWKNEFYILNGQNSLTKLLKPQPTDWISVKKKWIFNFFKFLVDYDNQFYIYWMNCCQLARCPIFLHINILQDLCVMIKFLRDDPEIFGLVVR